MQPRVLITNGGPHPAATWANLTASDIVVVSPDATEDALQAGNLFKIKLTGVLEKHHDLVQQYERNELKRDKKRLDKPLKPTEMHVAAAVKDIVAAADGTPFADHFKRDDVQSYLNAVVERHFAQNINVERGWHRDRLQEV